MLGFSVLASGMTDCPIESCATAMSSFHVGQTYLPFNQEVTCPVWPFKYTLNRQSKINVCNVYHHA